MKFRLLDLHQSGREDLPRVLFYSVVVHYLFFYFLFGNPFQILTRQNRGVAGQAALDVELLTPSQIDGDAKLRQANEDPYPIVFPPEEGTDDEDRIKVKEEQKAESVSEEGMNVVESAAPLPPSPEKKKERKLPPNMTGPQDCMLKLIDMVCPNGDFNCIEAYKTFCENLPREGGSGSASGTGRKQ